MYKNWENSPVSEIISTLNSRNGWNKNIKNEALSDSKTDEPIGARILHRWEKWKKLRPFVYVSSNLKINYFRNFILLLLSLKPYFIKLCWFLRIDLEMLLTVSIRYSFCCFVWDRIEATLLWYLELFLLLPWTTRVTFLIDEIEEI